MAAAAKKLHFAPAARVERNGQRIEGWSQINDHGLPTFPHCTKPEALLRAKQQHAEAVFHTSFRTASVTAARRTQ